MVSELEVGERVHRNYLKKKEREHEVTDRRLTKLMNFLQKLEEWQFDYTDWVAEAKIVKERTCGTVCCMAGWLPKVNRRMWCWDDDGVAMRGAPSYNIVESLETYFPALKVEYDDEDSCARALFMDGEQFFVKGGYSASAADVRLPQAIFLLNYWIEHHALPGLKSYYLDLTKVKK